MSKNQSKLETEILVELLEMINKMEASADNLATGVTSYRSGEDFQLDPDSYFHGVYEVGQKTREILAKHNLYPHGPKLEEVL